MILKASCTYCWWTKSCTTWDVSNPVNNGIFTISTSAGFLPSTVGLEKKCSLNWNKLEDYTILAGGWDTHFETYQSIGLFLQVGVKVKNLWNHHLEYLFGTFQKNIVVASHERPLMESKAYTTPQQKRTKNKKHILLMIEAVTFSSPIVRGHQQPLKGSRELTIPKRSHQENHLDKDL